MSNPPIPTGISPELRAFLQDWIDWVDRGAPDDQPYAREYGLCYNSVAYPGNRLWAQLDYIFGGRHMPFGGDYYYRTLTGTQHECPNRLAWVRATLEANPKED